MRIFDLELLLHLLVMVLGYGLGFVASMFGLRLFGLRFVSSWAAWLVLVLPLASAVIVEYMTEFWQGTPGTVGLGSLVVFMPMLVAGLVLGIAATVLPRFIEPYELHFARGSGSLTLWIVIALVGVALTLALWRWWPEPTARLW